MLKPGFIDLSHHNTIPESLLQAKQSGIVGVIHKATEGTSFVDDKLDSRAHLARDAGLLFGVYHFVRPGSMDAQVDHFLNATANIIDDDTLFALDWEDPGVSLEDAIEFMERVEEITGCSPVLYSGHVCKEAMSGPDPRINCYRLWLAQYGPEPELPPGWKNFWGWQYTDQGSVPGIDPPVDLNAFDGTPEELRDQWAISSSESGGTEPAPEPEPEPEPVEPIDVLVIAPPGVNVRVVSSLDEIEADPALRSIFTRKISPHAL